MDSKIVDEDPCRNALIPWTEGADPRRIRIDKLSKYCLVFADSG
jgi:hypothetical protein